MKDYQCLMIKTKDKRKFFTHEANLPQIIEFSKMFKAEISTVQVSEAQILDLEELAPAFCNASYTQPSSYKLLKTMFPTKRKRKNILKNSAKIRDFIRTKLFKRGQISLDELKDRFKDEGLTTACFCNHLRFMKSEIVDMGKNLVKVSVGMYRIEEISGS